MDYKYIEQLIERYFEAETSVAEENILHSFFGQNDVPAHLQKYASLFAYTANAGHTQVLGEDFDRRLFARLEASGDAPMIHVKVKRMTFTERIQPLWRAAAAVAIVVLMVGSARQAMVTTSQQALIHGGGEALQVEKVEETLDPTKAPFQQMQYGMKMAATIDSTKSETPQ